MRHTFVSRLAESQASDATIMALAGHLSRKMMERYSHTRMEEETCDRRLGCIAFLATISTGRARLLLYLTVLSILTLCLLQ
jgi:hypothetical protein